ncbi:hypothetical protein [Azospirillum agricola]|uniref:hypothetical protein n=1 Tax=Azospirillum agricola TaxID=1720247 RepID=UPI000A0EF98C|nr:hypothetical protein [Azospirillum agricola]SMH47558.1 hypothetical protein SAMN02982994_2624 [Azospirillum lipoferum]
MTKHIPPVPPAGRSNKGPAGVPESAPADTAAGNAPPANLKEQDRQGNAAQNTTHQGLQQDR